MSDLLEKCTVCGALIDEEDLFCANCGTEAPHAAPQEAASTEMATHSFLCNGCGASMNYDASSQSLRCPFCGSEQLDRQQETKVLAARKVVPMKLQQTEVTQLLHRWMGNSFWRPSDLAERSVITKLTPVYVPYWVFQANTFTYWTADSSATPPGARGDWCPVAGEHRSNYSGVLIGASSVLTPSETSAICPFDLGDAVPRDQIDLEGYVCEQFRVQRKYARPLARRGLEEMERQACKRYVSGRVRNLKVNMRLEGLASQPVLLPVWIMAYRYKGKLYRFLVNGQTGRHSGRAPFSWAKLMWVIGIAAAVLIVLLMVVGLMSLR